MHDFVLNDRSFTLSILGQYFRHSIGISPDSGHSKYMYLGQMLQGQEAVESFKKGIELMVLRQAQQSSCVSVR